MSQESLEYFGEEIITKVRDKAILRWDKLVSGEMKGDTSKKVSEKLKAFDNNQKEVLNWIIPQIVDSTLHFLLVMLEQDENISVGIEYEGEFTQRIQDVSDGLAGELYTEEGWIAYYSKERL